MSGLVWLIGLVGCFPGPLGWDGGSSGGTGVLGVAGSLSSSEPRPCVSRCRSDGDDGCFAGVGDEGTLSVSGGKLPRLGPGDVCHGEVPAGWSASLGR